MSKVTMTLTFMHHAQNKRGVVLSEDDHPLKFWRLLVKLLDKLFFTFKAIVTLTFMHHCQKTIVVFYSVRATIL